MPDNGPGLRARRARVEPPEERKENRGKQGNLGDLALAGAVAKRGAFARCSLIAARAVIDLDYKVYA